VWPILFHIGPQPIYSFGTMMAVAFLVGGSLVRRELNRKNLNGDLASSIVFWAAVGGIGGSRIWAVAEDWRSFLDHPFTAIFSGAGFVWYGGLAGGALAVSLFMRHHKLPWLRVVDCVAPALALGYGIGRIGCLLAGDGDWGPVSDLPWAMSYPNAIYGWDYPAGVRVHPTPIYEALLSTGIFAILWSIRKRPHPDGTIFWWYLILMSIERFFIEYVRINDHTLFGLTHPQIVSVVLVAIGAWRLLAGSTEPIAPRPRKIARSASR
jgi:phosphatidylglycerol:prolipoprotein diacylglycerol transferase